jgi:hypothetical protein
MKQVTDGYALQMFQWNIARNRLDQHQQQMLQQQQQQRPYNNNSSIY